MLFNYTEQGIRSIKDSPSRVRAITQQLKGTGVNVLGWYLTLGSYDGVALFEAPDDETAAQMLLSLGGQGNVRTTTLRAFSLEEAEKIINKLG
jgi:uncharacterized protein with GYD domain